MRLLIGENDISPGLVDPLGLVARFVTDKMSPQHLSGGSIDHVNRTAGEERVKLALQFGDLLSHTGCEHRGRHYI